MDVDAYLDRLGVARPAAADLATLRHLQERHLATVPFENLSIHLGEHVVLAEDALFDKIVRRRRGGFCYELNGLFAALLRELGYRASLHAAQVFHADGTPGPPLDHAAIVVTLDEPWLVDVGFGRFSRYPLRLSGVDAQPDPDGEFLLLDAPHGDVDVLLDGKPQYRLERRPRPLSDFVPMAWWQSTSPESHFTRSLTCSRPTSQGRVTLSGDKLIETVDGVRNEVVLPTEAAIRTAYRVYFGISLNRLPTPPGESPLTPGALQPDTAVQ
ncbi:arylamine N-acetyltransferase family protein [Amycolatopsis australiensis]|uniref:N-hydroxyarylamine O-acetyltransferase n=1 Tax=Amycolatopsis australiensis TaxID=546364 RepID=A0A1K1QS57_9PSEU|nr:arylamine N-acetyltransferase [Amycolatopsis australiensis]SFW62118.1 N-hydroxyarylamine O-acetyltransferase [Amycolatopsis australiensis]